MLLPPQLTGGSTYDSLTQSTIYTEPEVQRQQATTDQLLKALVGMCGGVVNSTYHEYLAAPMDELVYDLAIFIEFKNDEQRSISKP